MLTPENFKTLVGYQECGGTGPLALAYLMGVIFITAPPPAPDEWVNNISDMTNDEVLDKLINDDIPPTPTMSFNINKQEVVCNQTLDEVLVEASNLLKSFPVFQTTQLPPFYLNSAKSRIAFKSRRGIGNAQLDNVLVYRGKNEFDCCLAIVKCNERYGIAKQQHFDSYGLLLDGTKI
jgi:hypothetical protein